MAEQLTLFDSDRTLRQKECVDKWIANKCIGTTVCPTGFGKTNIGLMAISRFLNKNPNATVIIAVPSEPIKLQWEEKLEELQLVASVRTYHNTSKNKYQCDLLVLDEIHRVGSEQLIYTFDNVKYKIILGLTATFERLDGRDKLISKHCPIVDVVTQQEAIAKGWLSKYKEFGEITKLKTYTANIVESNGTIRTEKWVNTNYFITEELLISGNVDMLAGKTGNTKSAGNCLILLTKDKKTGLQYISVVLNAKSKRNSYYNSNALLSAIVR